MFMKTQLESSFTREKEYEITNAAWPIASNNMRF
jgi:hypothetical protein